MGPDGAFTSDTSGSSLSCFLATENFIARPTTWLLSNNYGSLVFVGTIYFISFTFSYFFFNPILNNKINWDLGFSLHFQETNILCLIIERRTLLFISFVQYPGCIIIISEPSMLNNSYLITSSTVVSSDINKHLYFNSATWNKILFKKEELIL